jgi:hypothetical protein
MKKILLTVIVLLFTQHLHAGELTVIVNEAGPLTEITETDIRDIYLGHIRFLKGFKVVPIHYREGPVKDAFLSSLVGMTSREYRRYWTRKSFKEGVPAPASQRSFKQIISSVKFIAGAIGYLPVSELDDTDGIRVIANTNK